MFLKRFLALIFQSLVLLLDIQTHKDVCTAPDWSGSCVSGRLLSRALAWVNRL